MIYRHSLTKGQMFELRHLLAEKAAVQRRIDSVLNIAVIDGELPKPVVGQWELDATDPEHMALVAEVPDLPPVEEIDSQAKSVLFSSGNGESTG